VYLLSSKSHGRSMGGKKHNAKGHEHVMEFTTRVRHSHAVADIMADFMAGSRM
jgi:hypothetical protein